MGGTERSVDEHRGYLEDANKLEYFITGVAGALAGYIGQDLRVTSLVLGGTTMELAALACFAGSFLSGVWRLQLSVHLRGMNAQKLSQHEIAGNALDTGLKGPGYSSEGQIFTQPQLLQRAVDANKTAAELERRLSRISDRTLFWYRVRNALLYGGMALLVVARLLPAIGRA